MSEVYTFSRSKSGTTAAKYFFNWSLEALESIATGARFLSEKYDGILLSMAVPYRRCK